MDLLDSDLMVGCARVPMAFIGGPLNLKPIPVQLLDSMEYEAIIPDTRERTVYVNVAYRLPHRPNTDFIFYVNQSSISLDEAAGIINTNFFK